MEGNKGGRRRDWRGRNVYGVKDRREGVSRWWPMEGRKEGVRVEKERENNQPSCKFLFEGPAAA